MFDEIIAPLFTTEWGRRAGWGTMIAMLILLVYMIFCTVNTWREDYIIAHAEHRVSNKSLSADDMTKLVAEIPQKHIFGQSGVTDNGGVVPITSLQLRLVGVIKSEPEEYSSVIISEAGKPGKVYRVGDTLSSGVKVHSIAEDGVILENGGRLEKLPLQRPPLMFQGMPKPLLPEDKAQEE